MLRSDGYNACCARCGNGEAKTAQTRVGNADNANGCPWLSHAIDPAVEPQATSLACSSSLPSLRAQFFDKRQRRHAILTQLRMPVTPAHVP